MYKLFITFASALLLLLNNNKLLAQKAVYIPTFITDTKMDLNDPASQWSYSRSKQSDNIILFWEAGFGADPSTATGVYKVDIAQLMANAEKCYTYYIDSLQFVSKGTSVTDKYKLMIFLLHSTEWAAYGSGQDDKVGSLHVNPAAANIKTVVAHEIGHCFQYITGCDTKGGFRYGLGENGDGGNGFWEQCAQWMAFKVYPEEKFNDRDFKYYTKSTYKHILHEDPRYSNFFIQDYWAFKRGLDAIGKIWRESTKPEDPVETYKRLFQLSQEKFNDEIYEQAVRLITWDLPAIKKDGAAFIDTRKQTKMNLVDGSWRIDTTECLQNYGYNSIKLEAPTTKTKVKVQFKGLAGEANYTTINKPVGGWRFGFVALLKDGTRVYSKMMKANVQQDKNPTQELSFTCPDNCTNLWLVVSGAPQAHSKHPWDDNPANDEEWPYEIKFTNTTYK